MLEIDDMTKEDASGVFLVAEECFTLPWSYKAFVEEADNKNAITLIALEDKEIIGFINARFLLGEMNINNIAVTKNSRRKGTGEALLQTLLIRARNEGVLEVMLEVRTSNESAISFYKKHGFIENGVRKNFYEQPREDALLMSMSL